jgi:hypothetical protein
MLLRGWVRLMQVTPRQGADPPTWLARGAEVAGESGKLWASRRELPCAFRDPDAVERLMQSGESTVQDPRRLLQFPRPPSFPRRLLPCLKSGRYAITTLSPTLLPSLALELPYLQVGSTCSARKMMSQSATSSQKPRR